MDVVVEKIYGGWVFTKIEDVKVYATSYDFRENNPDLYKIAVKMIAYSEYLRELKQK
ncbi:hypothetical protein [Paramaledivibacter caminithermalis]|jgi:hypothetical protein|uniref:hypothetical protein n=1 Tax=Paramaledivibacter caminithermalis TaxID=191027 RepID=UPI0013F4C53D|nr:hypothetical protein [Paramaledivibacter caminithermalis]